jgi:CheY-like chemotaxis protein
MPNKKILLADASEPVHKVVNKAFEDEDYLLTVAVDYGSAIKMIAAEAPSLILVGASLPGKDGYSLCEFVKSNAPSIPVVLLVGTDETLNSDEAERVGVDEYFIRPFKTQDLIEKIDELMTASPKLAAAAHIQASEPEPKPEAAPEPEDDFLMGNADDLLGNSGGSGLVEEPSALEVSDSAEDLLSEMGIPDVPLEELDVVYTNEPKDEAAGVAAAEDEDDDDESIEDFLSDLDSGGSDDELEIIPQSATDSVSDDLIDDMTADLSDEFSEELPEELTEELPDEQIGEQIEEPATESGPGEISFNEDAVIEDNSFTESVPEEQELLESLVAEPELTEPELSEPKLVEPEPQEVEKVAALNNVDKKGVAVEGIVEISKTKIEELILKNTKEDVKEIAFQLVPGLAKEPIAQIVPDAVQKAAEKFVGEIVSEKTGLVAEGIVKEIAAEIVSKKATEHIAQIAGEAVMKAAEERMKEIANEAADKMARELISKIVTDTTVKAAEDLITDEIKKFKSTLSKEG